MLRTTVPISDIIKVERFFANHDGVCCIMFNKKDKSFYLYFRNSKEEWEVLPNINIKIDVIKYLVRNGFLIYKEGVFF